MDDGDLGPRERLLALAGAYAHARNERRRRPEPSARRRGFAHDAERIVERFERTLDHWVRDDATRAAWEAHFHGDAPAPEGPQLRVPPLFRGTTDANAILEVRASGDGGYDLLIDDKLTEHHDIPWHLDEEQADPVLIQDWMCTEVFSASPPAVAALEQFLDRAGASPPWAFVRELYEDGLVDSQLGLTARGARRLGHRAVESEPSGERLDYCILVADRARARILTLTGVASAWRPTLATLQLAGDLSDPRRRARDAERFSDTRPGLRREGAHGPRHAVSDRREQHRRETAREFSTRVVEEAVWVWRRLTGAPMLVVAEPQMLGLLRPVLAAFPNGPTSDQLVELARDLTPLEPPAIHDALADAGLLPPRGRPPPIPRMRGPNPWDEGSARPAELPPRKRRD